MELMGQLLNANFCIGHDMISSFSEQLTVEKWALCSCALLLCLDYSGEGLSVF